MSTESPDALRSAADGCFVCGPANPVGLGVRYRAPLPLGTPVRLEGRCSERRGRLARMEGQVIRQDTGAVVAQSTGSFMIQPAPAGRASPA